MIRNNPMGKIYFWAEVLPRNSFLGYVPHLVLLEPGDVVLAFYRGRWYIFHAPPWRSILFFSCPQRKSVDWGTMGPALGGEYECYAHNSSFEIFPDGNSAIQLNVKFLSVTIKRFGWHYFYGFQHPDYNMGHRQVADLTIVKLKTPLTFSTAIRPICLPDPTDASLFSPGTQCVVAGWGDTKGETSFLTEHLRSLPFLSFF